MSEEELAVWRGKHVGVVFQFFQLLPTLTALENAMLPLDFARRGSKRERRERALHNLELVGLADMADRLPSEMSGGQQQRVAIARALASYPTLVIGDEPTGNLDTKTAAEMFELLAARLRRGRDGALRHARPRARGARGPRRSRSATASWWTSEEAVMSSAILRKSVTDLTRRKARAFFTVLTLALAVASVGLFAVPALMQQAMDREIAANRLADVTLTTKPLVARRRRSCSASSSCPNVRGVAATSLFSTRMYVGARRDKALVVGVRDFARQQADVVAPRPARRRGAGAVLSDTQNAAKGKFDGSTAARSSPPTGARGRCRSAARAARSWAAPSWPTASRPSTRPPTPSSSSAAAAATRRSGCGWRPQRAGRRPHDRGRPRRSCAP